MTLADSSCWFDYFIGGPSMAAVEKYLVHEESLLVPTLVVYEVYRQLIKKIETKEALHAVVKMEQGRIVPLTNTIALHAAELSLQYKLGTADAIIYATAQSSGATLVTLDNDFRNLPQCVVLS